jgi:hypothetical protein
MRLQQFDTRKKKYLHNSIQNLLRLLLRETTKLLCYLQQENGDYKDILFQSYQIVFIKRTILLQLAKYPREYILRLACVRTRNSYYCPLSKYNCINLHNYIVKLHYTLSSLHYNYHYIS